MSSLSLLKGLSMCQLFCGWACLWLAGGSSVAIAQSSGNASRPLERIRIATDQSTSKMRAILINSGFDVLHGQSADHTIDVITSARDREQLGSMNLHWTVVDHGRPFAEIQAERQSGFVDEVPDGYWTLDEIYAEMDRLETEYPDICKRIDLTDTYSAPPTVEGRHIYALKISDNVASAEDEPSVLVVSAHHCRELVTPVLALHAMNELARLYETDPDIRDLVDANEIWIAPVWNVDGYEYVFLTDNMWRKNRRDLGDDTFGVDLNRNYPFLWDTPCSGSTKKSSQTYKGESPNSEAETQTMVNFSDVENFDKIIDFHSSGRESLYAYRCDFHGLTSWLEDEAVALSEAAGYDGKHRPPSAQGEQYQYQLGVRGAHSFLIETHEEFQPEYDSALAEAVTVWPSIVWMLQREIPLSGVVTDAASGDPLQVDIQVNHVHHEIGNPYQNGQMRGNYRAFLPEGQFEIRFSAPGWKSQTHVVDVVGGQPIALNIAMVTSAFNLDASTLVAGEDAAFTIINGKPNVAAFLFYSLQGPGMTYVPSLQVDLDLDHPRLASSRMITDEDGTAEWMVSIPNRVGVQAWFQGAQFAQTTNTINRTTE